MAQALANTLTVSGQSQGFQVPHGKGRIESFGSERARCENLRVGTGLSLFAFGQVHLLELLSWPEAGLGDFDSVLLGEPGQGERESARFGIG